MNPETNRFEKLIETKDEDLQALQRRFNDAVNTSSQLVRPNGDPVPKHWTVLTVGEEVVVKNYTFKVAHIGDSHLLLEPVGIPVIGGTNVYKGTDVEKQIKNRNAQKRNRKRAK